MNRRLRTMSVAAIVALAVAGGYQLRGARASGIPGMNTLSYSGTLIMNGQPENASHFILLKLWEKDNPSAACSTIPAGNTSVINGRFTLPLDSSCVAVIHKSPDVQVEVVIDGVTMGKSALAAVPYAVEADTATNFAPGSAIANLMPTGTVVPFAGAVGGAVKPPAGWLLCDGSQQSRTTYAALFATIGTAWGSGDGATSFNLPELRGRFLRGADQGSGNDPGPRNPIQAGGNPSGVGTLEGGDLASHSHGVNDPGHSHTIPAYQNVAGGNWGLNQLYNNVNGYLGPVGLSASATGISIAASGGTETRPVNAAVNYIIKL